MLAHKKNFPATSKNSDDVGIRVNKGGSSHVLLCTKKLVESFDFRMFVDEDYLPAILNHAMTCKTKKSKDSLVGIMLAEAIQLVDHLVTVFHLGFNQG